MRKKIDKITKNNIEQKQKKLAKGISQETWDFIERSNKFLKENNIKPKKFTYKTGLESGSYSDHR